MMPILSGERPAGIRHNIAQDCQGQKRPSAMARRSLKPYSIAMPFLANSFFAFSFLTRRVRPMPRSTLGALVN